MALNAFGTQGSQVQILSPRPIFQTSFPMNLPYIEKLPYQKAEAIFSHFADEAWAVFLDSASLPGGPGRFSFIAADPFLKLQSKNGFVQLNDKTFQANPFLILQENLKNYQTPILSDYPPFQGGALGYFAYDLCHHLEKLPRNKDDMQFPDMMIGFYDVCIAIDNLKKEVWLFSQGFPETEESNRIARAVARATWLKRQLANIPQLRSFKHNLSEITANFSQKNYEKNIQRVKNYIYQGDIFQANIAQRFSADLPQGFDTVLLYQDLRRLNPAPFSAYLNYEEIKILSASPERFLKLHAGKIETRPIKGTRPRGKNPAEDLRLANELLNSSKDRAENIMIVDLLRNDLSKVCENYSVKVEKLCGLESYASVHHLVSVVTAKLKPEYDAVDLLMATFPGGSITGAPKIRAMEIIAEIEPTQRGPYCGSIGYIGFNGDMDLSIVIRSFAIKNNRLTFQAGGGIVADSEPDKEYEETLVKASALRKIL